MRTVVLGAGGLGSALAAHLHSSGGDVALVARGAHLDAIRADGLRVEGTVGTPIVHLPVEDSLAEIRAPELVLVTVKAYSLDSVAPDLVAAARAGAVVVPLLNGVDAVERLVAAGVPSHRLATGIAYFTAFREGPGRVRRVGEHGRLVLGSGAGEDRADGSREQRYGGVPTTVLQDAANSLQIERLEVSISPRIETLLWRKMAVVCGLTACCVLAGGTMGAARSHPYGRHLQTAALEEVLAEAWAAGVALPDDEMATLEALLDGFPPAFYPSVVHDARTGRATEVDHLNGAIARRARAAGRSASVNTATAAILSGPRHQGRSA